MHNQEFQETTLERYARGITLGERTLLLILDLVEHFCKISSSVEYVPANSGPGRCDRQSFMIYVSICSSLSRSRPMKTLCCLA